MRLYFSPAQLAISAVDLKAVVNTKYQAIIAPIDPLILSGLLEVVEGGTSASGVAKIFATPVNDLGVAIGPDIDLVTSISLVNSISVYFSLNGGSGVVASTGGTAVASGIAALAFRRMKIGVQITTADTGTGNTIAGSLSLWSGSGACQ